MSNRSQTNVRIPRLDPGISFTRMNIAGYLPIDRHIRNLSKPGFRISSKHRVFEINTATSPYSIVQIIPVIFVSVLIIMLVTACATPDQTTLDKSVTSNPGWSRSKSSLASAFHDPNVWGTLLAAALLQSTDLDHEISDQLREDTPLFGSTQEASDASFDFRDLTEMAYISTALLTPGPDTPGEWFSTKALLLGSEWLTVEMGQIGTSELKTITERERPNFEDKESFVSGHVSAASAQAQMAGLNVEYLPIDETSKLALNITINSFAALTAWARVEAGEHYASDVLAGWALGHFVSHIGQGFIDPGNQQVLVRPRSGPDETGIELIFRF